MVDHDDPIIDILRNEVYRLTERVEQLEALVKASGVRLYEYAAPTLEQRDAIQEALEKHGQRQQQHLFVPLPPTDDGEADTLMAERVTPLVLEMLCEKQGHGAAFQMAREAAANLDQISLAALADYCEEQIGQSMGARIRKLCLGADELLVFSLPRESTPEELDELIRSVSQMVKQLREERGILIHCLILRGVDNVQQFALLPNKKEESQGGIISP